MWKNVLKTVGFLVVFLILFLWINSILKLKHEDGIVQMEMFYRQKENTVDVLCLGSSHVFANIDPAILEEEYGIASYDLAGSMQPMWNTYYCLKEALKYQKPSLIILDVFRLTEGFSYSKESKVVKNTYGMRLSMNKIKSIQESAEKEEDVLRHVFGIGTYHDRYYELEEKDFLAELERMILIKDIIRLWRCRLKRNPEFPICKIHFLLRKKRKDIFIEF